jgi:hypothetical protein
VAQIQNWDCETRRGKTIKRVSLVNFLAQLGKDDNDGIGEAPHL